MEIMILGKLFLICYGIQVAGVICMELYLHFRNAPPVFFDYHSVSWDTFNGKGMFRLLDAMIWIVILLFAIGAPFALCA